MTNRGQDWRSILLGIASLAGALSAFTIAGLMVIYSLFGLFRSDLSQRDPSTLQTIIVASGITLIGVAFLPSAYYSFQRLRGAEIPEAAPKPLKVWQGLLLMLLWAGSANLAQFLVNRDIFKWLTPGLYFLAVGTPVYILIRLIASGLNPGSRHRIWGIPVVSVALGTTLSLIAEAALIIFILTGGAVYLGLHPGQFSAFKQIADQIKNAPSIESAMNIVEPWLNNPVAVLLALFFFSGITPVIEETAKSIATWTIFDHLKSPGQGFVIGALSGAGFGLVESLLASATPDSNWAATLMVRGGSTMMHIMTASLTGWGIATFHTRKSGGALIGSFGVAVFLHSLWNAAVIMIVFGGLRMPSNGGSPDSIGLVLMVVGISVLVFLCLAIPLALGLINRRLRLAPLLPPLNLTGADTGTVSPHPGEDTEGVQ